MSARKQFVLAASYYMALCTAALAGTLGQAQAAVYVVDAGGPRRGRHQPGLGGEAVQDRPARRRRGQAGRHGLRHGGQV